MTTTDSPVPDTGEPTAADVTEAAAVATEPEPAAEAHDAPALHVPWPLRIFGVLLVISGAALLLGMLGVGTALILSAVEDGYVEFKTSTIVLLVVEITIQLLLALLYLRLGIGLLRDRRRHSAGIARTLMFLLIASIIVHLMIDGVTTTLISDAALISITIALQSYLDPSLAEERQLMRKLRRLEARSDEEERLAQLRHSRGKAPFELNFFNIFGTFLVCSVLGLIIEDIYHAVVFGGYQDRAGLLFGPFSPIYGFGAVLMTLGLNRIRDKNVILIFLLSAIIGGAFEYFVSWFMQSAFGITAWDYTGTFLSIDGRTNGFFMACWGVLGVVWVKWLLPSIFKLIYLIPWDWRYAVTTVATVLMVVDGVMTLQALDCWYERASGQAIEPGFQQFYAEYFDDDYMANRFQTMTMNVEDSSRIS